MVAIDVVKPRLLVRERHDLEIVELRRVALMIDLVRMS
jgi:hypothetical protein